MRTVEDLLSENITGRKVLVRSDLNVPLRYDGDSTVITDDGRIRASLPTLQALRQAGARLVDTAHLGRPHGPGDTRLSLAPVAQQLESLMGMGIAFASDTVGESARSQAAQLENRQILLVENVRFDSRETSKDDSQRQAMAHDLMSLVGQDGAFISDGFGVVHRKQASVYDIASLLDCYAGTLVAAETAVLQQLTISPARPYAVVLGGAKVSDKLGVITALLDKVDTLLIGGGMAYTFLAAQGLEVGGSLLEKNQVQTCGQLLDAHGEKILLPSDIVIADDFAADANTQIVAANAIPASWQGLDIGPQTCNDFAAALSDCATVFWNGPMGVFEMPAFAHGTRAVATAISESSAFSVVGGGDSAAAVRALNINESGFSHISTGGGASLEFLEGKALPGLAVLEK